MAEIQSQPGWWDEYRDLFPPAFIRYLEAESTAQATYQFDPFVVNGLLQTEAYARAICAPGYPGSASPGLYKNMVEVRLKRQWNFFERENPPQLHSIIDESVLFRRVGGEQVLYEQLQHLLQMAALPNVSLQIISWNSGKTLSWWYDTGGFRLHDYDGERPNLVCREDAFSVMTFESNPLITSWYGEGFKHLRRDALSPEATIRHLTELTASPESIFQGNKPAWLWPAN